MNYEDSPLWKDDLERQVASQKGHIAELLARLAGASQNTAQKRIFKYGTGEVVPAGAQYLGTVAQTEIQGLDNRERWHPCFLVWHYFLVDA